MELTKDTLTKIDEVIGRYPEKRSATLMVIHLVQDDQGCITDEAVEWIAEKLELQPVNIYEVVTFYPMIRQEKPWGKTHVRVCRTLPCALRGSYKTCRTLEEKLGVKEGHVSEDGDFSIEFMECLADCGKGPVVIVDEKTYEDVQGEAAEKFAEQVKNGTLDKDRDFTSYEDGLAKPRKKTVASRKKGAGKK
jgi:NADH-quinone oxidoreductase subunit E